MLLQRVRVDPAQEGLSDVRVEGDRVTEISAPGERLSTAGDDADAACYIYADVDGTSAWGVGIAGSTTRASLEAIVSAVNRSTAAN